MFFKLGIENGILKCFLLKNYIYESQFLCCCWSKSASSYKGFWAGLPFAGILLKIREMVFHWQEIGGREMQDSESLAKCNLQEVEFKEDKE